MRRLLKEFLLFVFSLAVLILAALGVFWVAGAVAHALTEAFLAGWERL